MIYRGVITAMSNAQKHALLYASLMMTENITYQAGNINVKPSDRLCIFRF